MTEEFNRKIKKAVDNLLTLEQVTLVGTLTSDYSYGMLPPCLEDRYNLDIKIDLDLTLKTQVSFDSKYLSFPPDIVIHNLPPEHSQDFISLLPQSDWSLDQEKCLYVWFKRILNLFKKPEPKKRWALFDDVLKRDHISHFEPSSSNTKRKRKEPLYKTNMDDDFEDDPSFYLQDEQEDMDTEDTPVYKKDRYSLKRKENFIGDSSKFFADQDEALSYKTREETFEDSLFSKESPASDASAAFHRNKRSTADHIMTDANDDDSDDDAIVLPPVRTKLSIIPRSTRLTSPEPLLKKKRTGLLKPKMFKMQNNTGEKFNYRKKFMSEWLSKYKRNIMKYDTENYSNFTLLIQFRSSKSEISSSFKKQKETSLKIFLEEHPDAGKISKFKQVAPVIVNFKMDRYSFPSSPLEIKLISVMNTTSVGSSEPDAMNLKYSVNQNESLSKTVNDIMNLITDTVPAFHCQLNEQ